MYLKFILLLFLFPAVSHAQLLTYKTISIEDGLLSTEVYNVFQDSKGYVWIGTQNGLFRWDSKRFESFTVAEGLPNNEVYFTYEDEAGRIWISSFSQELCYYNGHIYNRKNTPFLDKIKHYPGSMITVDKNELYYVSVDYKFKKFNLISKKLMDYGKQDGNPSFVFVKYKNKIWGIQDERNIDVLVKGKASNIVMNNDTSYFTPYCLGPNPGSDIVTLVDFKNKWYSFQHSLGTPFYKARYKDDQFQIAVYNEGKILEVYKDYVIQKKEHYVMKIDNAGRGAQIFPLKSNLFMRVTNGLLFCRHIPILEYEHNPEINNNAKFIFKYKKDVYIVNGKYQLINVSKQKQVNQFQNNPVNFYNLLSYENRIYVATSFNVYYFSDPNKIIQDSRNLDVHNIKQISKSKKVNEFFVAGGIGKGVFLMNFKKKTINNLFYSPQKAVYSVFEDSKSRLWYTTPNSVYYTSDYYNGIRNSKEFILDSSKALFCKSVLEDNNGNIFFVSNGGIFVFDGTKKYRIDNTNFLSDNECRKVIIDTIHKSFWVATKNGLNQIGYSRKKDTLRFRVLSKFFTTDGLRSNVINDILLDSNKLYIGTEKGVNVLDNVTYRPDSTRIPVYIKLIAVNGTNKIKNINLKDIQLSHTQNNLTIGFSALYFLRRDRLKIKGYLYRDNSLISRNEITEDKIDYYSLNDGNYKLVLYAYDEDYVYNNGRSSEFIFTINPPYYKTWWFIIGTSLLVIVISTSLLLWNLNRRKKRAIAQAELQSKLNESTLKSLQSQMNPHFVFNSLNTIQSFITEKNEEGAIGYLSDFSGLMREILEQSVHTFISLENEIQFLQHYIQLEITRFKDSFDITWNIDLEEDDLTDIYIPTMLIQPILENAVKHGVSSLFGARGHIDVTFRLAHENLLEVTVKDNGRPLTHKNFKGNTIAVKTIKERLNIYTKNKLKGEYILQISENGATATVTIPI